MIELAPEKWHLAILVSLADVQLGKMLDSSKNRSGVRLPYLRNTNVRWGRIDTTDLAEMYFEEDEVSRFSLKQGDVLVCEGGEPGRAAVWDGSVPNMMYQKALHRVRFKSEYEPSLLVYWLELLAKSGQLDSSFTGSTIKHFTLEAISRLSVPDAPLRTQSQLLSELELHLSRLDVGIEALQRAQRELKRYRASVLRDACQGQLVVTDAEVASNEGVTYTPAQESLRAAPEIQKPSRWKSRSKDKILGHAALTVGASNKDLPEGWCWVPLVEVARMSSGHTPSRRHAEYWNGDIPWVGLVDARENDGRVIRSTFENTNTIGLENSAAQALEPGTVCVSRTASVGYVVVLGRTMATSQDFVNWTPGSAVTSDWLRIVFSADRRALQSFGKGSVHNTIYFPEWMSMYIALPPISEQKRIAAEVDKYLSVATSVEQTVNSSIAQGERLRAAILYSLLGSNTSLTSLPAPKKSVREERVRRSRSRTTPLGNLKYYEGEAHTKEELANRLRAAGGTLRPGELLYVSRLDKDVDQFFDLLREAQSTQIMDVPIGSDEAIRLKADAN